jgi:hypothetical protein
LKNGKNIYGKVDKSSLKQLSVLLGLLLSNVKKKVGHEYILCSYLIFVDNFGEKTFSPSGLVIAV